MPEFPCFTLALLATRQSDATTSGSTRNFDIVSYPLPSLPVRVGPKDCIQLRRPEALLYHNIPRSFLISSPGASPFCTAVLVLPPSNRSCLTRRRPPPKLGPHTATQNKEQTHLAFLTNKKSAQSSRKNSSYNVSTLCSFLNINDRAPLRDTRTFQKSQAVISSQRSSCYSFSSFSNE